MLLSMPAFFAGQCCLTQMKNMYNKRPHIALFRKPSFQPYFANRGGRRQPLAPTHGGDELLLQGFALNIQYPVIFSRNVFHPSNHALLDVIARQEPTRRHGVAVVIDSGVATAWPEFMEMIVDYFGAHSDRLRLAIAPMIVGGGERCKAGMDEVLKLQRWMLDAKLDRQSVLLTIGGGAMLDMSGFAAATFHRGIRLIRLPSTVLAQNDAGIGVKNGINSFGLKNLIGSFAAPFGVIADFDFLNTLEDRDRRAGLAEAVKVGLIRDGDFFNWLEDNVEALAQFSPRETETMIRRCAALHLAHIAEGGDPFEHGSARPLDFGHWAAHKLEAMSEYRLRHGEAVAIGIALDALYSSEIGLLSAAHSARIFSLLEGLGFVLWDELLLTLENRMRLIGGLDEFREHLGGELMLTMLTHIGSAIEVNSINQPILERALELLASRTNA